MPKSVSKKRKRPVQKGILGYPKKTKLLFFINQDDSNDDNSDTSDPDFDTTETTKQKIRPCRSKTTTAHFSSHSNMQQDWSKNLPYEILLKIFIYFSFSAEGDLNKIQILKNVCTNWAQVAQDPKLWHHINILNSLQLSVTKQHTSNKAKDATRFDTKLNKFINTAVRGNKFDYLSNLDLSSCEYLTCDHLEAILTACNPDVLRTLNLSHCKKVYATKYDTEAVYEKVIADNCPKLTSLNLTGMHKQLNAQNLKYLFARCGPTLRSLFISENVLSVAVLNEITENCPHLSNLHMSNSELKGILQFNSKSFPANLKSLHMLQTHPKTKFTSIYSVLTAESPCLQHLESFSFSYSTGFSTDQTAYTIAKVCKDALFLKTLDIRNYKSSFSLSSVNLFDMIASDKIEWLYLSGSRFDSWEVEYLARAIAARWRKSLVEIDLSWSSLSAEHLQLILDAFGGDEEELTRLRAINLSGTCVRTDMIKGFIKKFPRIDAVNLSSCRSVERGLKKLLNRSDLVGIFLE